MDTATQEAPACAPRTAAAYKSSTKPIWCPGCGDYTVLNAVTKALALVGKPPHEVAVVSGIGCSSRIPAYTSCYGFHGVHGRALAAGTGLKVARPDLTVLVSPYTSMADLAQEFYPWVPSLLHRYQLDTLGRLKAVPGPVLLLHGERDSLIGTHHAKKLAQAAPHARLLIVPGAEHNDIDITDMVNAQRARITEFLATLDEDDRETDIVRLWRHESAAAALRFLERLPS